MWCQCDLRRKVMLVPTESRIFWCVGRRSRCNLTLTRQQLYDQIWAETVTKIAKRLGLSDRGLAKLCFRCEIPVPPRGYWARRSAGYTDAKPALPVAKRPADEVIWIEPQPKGPSVATAPTEAKSDERQEDLIVIRGGPPLHHLVRLTGAALRGSTADQYGRRWGGSGVLDVRVSKANVSRALTILDALLGAAEDRGHQVSVKDRKDQH